MHVPWTRFSKLLSLHPDHYVVHAGWICGLIRSTARCLSHGINSWAQEELVHAVWGMQHSFIQQLSDGSSHAVVIQAQEGLLHAVWGVLAESVAASQAAEGKQHHQKHLQQQLTPEKRRFARHISKQQQQLMELEGGWLWC